MKILVHTDNHLRGSQEWTEHVEAVVAAALQRFGDQVTRVEMHFSDETGGAKERPNDKRCVMEVRLAGLQPLSVTYEASTLEQVLEGGVDRLEQTIDRTLGKLSAAKGRTPMGGDTEG